MPYPCSHPGAGIFLFIFDLNPPGYGALFLLRAAARPCKKQTAFLLRLANFPCGTQSALEKIGALRQARLAVSAAGSASACLPPAAARHPPFGGNGPITAPFWGQACSGFVAGDFAALPGDIFTHLPAHRGPPGLRPRPYRGSKPITAPSICRLCHSRKALPDGCGPVNGKREQSVG